MVPVALSYDRVLEERALARQLAGEPKQKESLLGLAATLTGLLRSAVSSCWRDMPHGGGGARGQRGARLCPVWRGHPAGGVPQGERRQQPRSEASPIRTSPPTGIERCDLLQAQAAPQGQEADSAAGVGVSSPQVCELLPEV